VSICGQQNCELAIRRRFGSHFTCCGHFEIAEKVTIAKLRRHGIASQQWIIERDKSQVQRILLFVRDATAKPINTGISITTRPAAAAMADVCVNASLENSRPSCVSGVKTGMNKRLPRVSYAGRTQTFLPWCPPHTTLG
jgi:hypothetical protein